MAGTKGRIVQPYLFFGGRCDEAIAFYRKAVGAKVTMLMRFKEAPEGGGCKPGMGNKVMHASLQIGETTVLASDGECQGKSKFEGFGLSLTTPDAADAKRAFTALSKGGKVQMPLAKTFFSPRFGMVADRFGVLWIIYVAPPETVKSRK